MKPTELGKRLVARRKHLGLKQRDVAQASGLSVSMISMLERGARVPTLNGTLERVARALQTTPADLLAWDVTRNESVALESLVLFLEERRLSQPDVRRLESVARVMFGVAP